MPILRPSIGASTPLGACKRPMQGKLEAESDEASRDRAYLAGKTARKIDAEAIEGGWTASGARDVGLAIGGADASGRKLWPLEKTLAERLKASSATNPVALEASRPLHINPSSGNRASSYDRYKFNLIVLTERNAIMYAIAKTLAGKYPHKTIILNLAGKTVAIKIPEVRVDRRAVSAGDAIKLQVLGHGTIDKAPGTTPRMCIGKQSAEDLSRRVPRLFKERLAMSLAKLQVKTTFIASTPDGEIGETGIKRAFVEDYIRQLHRIEQVSLADNFASIHSTEIAIAEDGRKCAHLGPNVSGKHTEPSNKDAWATTNNRDIEKIVYKYTASNLEPLGKTPQHYQRIHLLEYIAEKQHIAYTPNPENLSIKFATSKYVIEEIKEGTTRFYFGAENFRKGKERTLYAIYDEGSKEFRFKLQNGPGNIIKLTPDEARTVLEKERGSGKTQFDLTIDGHGINSLVPHHGIVDSISDISGAEWGEIVHRALSCLGTEGMTIDSLFLSSCTIGGMFVSETDVRSNPRFASDLVRELRSYKHVSEKTVIIAPAASNVSYPTIPESGRALFVTRIKMSDADISELKSTPSIRMETNCRSEDGTYDTYLETDNLTFFANLEDTTKIKSPSDQAVVKDIIRSRSIISEIIRAFTQIRDNQKYMDVVGGMFHYRMAPDEALVDVTEQQREVRLSRLKRTDVNPHAEPSAVVPGDA